MLSKAILLSLSGVLAFSAAKDEAKAQSNPPQSAPAQLSLPAGAVPYVSAVSVNRSYDFPGEEGIVTMSAWAGDCQMTIEAKAEVLQVPTLVKGQWMEAIVITLYPKLAKCSSTLNTKLLTATRNLGQLEQSALESIPLERRGVLPRIFKLPDVTR